MKMLNLLLLILLLTASTSFAKVDSLLPGLAKTGTGTINYLGIFKVYDAELYTSPGLQSSAILNEDSSKCLVLNYDMDLSAEDIIKGANAVLKRQHDQGVLDDTSKYIDILHSNYDDVRSGDSYTLCYDSVSSVTQLLYNHEEVVAIPSAEFARVYFGIWLGAKEPISDSLRDDLLAELSLNK